MKVGNIILLNGTSSSGKTSIVKALQHILDEPYLDAGIDKFLFMLPSRYLNQPLWSEVFEYVYTNRAANEFTIKTGARGRQIISGMHQAIAGLARAGNNVVADHVLLERAWLWECLDLFRDFNVFFVGVRCPLEILEQREHERRDRTFGQARAMFRLVHTHGEYDTEVDTSISSPLECARQIQHKLFETTTPRAFSRIRTQDESIRRSK